MVRYKETPKELFVIGLIIVLVGVVVFFFDTGKATLTCLRENDNQGSCKLVTSKIFGNKTIEIPISDIYGAKLYEKQDPDSKTYKYSVVLQTKSAEIDLSLSYSTNYDLKNQVVSKINNFIKNTGEVSLSVSDNDGGLILLTSLALILFGIILIIRSRIAVLIKKLHNKNKPPKF